MPAFKACGLTYIISWLTQGHLASFNGEKVLLCHVTANVGQTFSDVGLLDSWSAQYMINIRPSQFYREERELSLNFRFHGSITLHSFDDSKDCQLTRLPRKG